MERYPILEAAHHNWSLIKAGDWIQTEWIIYCDGTYIRKSRYNMTMEEILRQINAGIYDNRKFVHVYTENGKMSMPIYSALLDAMAKTPWRPDGEMIHACDGDAWEFQQFDMIGKTVQDSGSVGYIYGNEILERIASLLPCETVFL